MKFQSELDFFIRILKSFNLPNYVVAYPFNDIPDMDLGIRKLLDPSKDYRSYLDVNPVDYPGNKIYYALDEFGCNYVFMLLPDTDPATYFFVGPFLTSPFESDNLYKQAKKYSVPHGLLKQVEYYYRYLPLVVDISSLHNIIISFAETIWGGKDTFTIEQIEDARMTKTKVASGISLYEDNEFPTFSVKRVEERYENENQFILAVSQGKFAKAEQYLIPYAFTNLEPI